VLEVLGVLSQMMEEIRDQLAKRWQSRSLCTLISFRNLVLVF
jgi:hypothetical protein